MQLSTYYIHCRPLALAYILQHLTILFLIITKGLRRQVISVSFFWLASLYEFLSPPDRTYRGFLFFFQSDWIRENCASQMERVRDNYNSQSQNIRDIKSYGSAQLSAVREQYYEQVRIPTNYSRHYEQLSCYGNRCFLCINLFGEKN